MHTIEKLFEGLPVVALSGRKNQRISGICTDSRRVSPGSMFFAFPGLRTDGHHYIEEAIDRGAAAIVSEEPAGRHPSVAYVQVESARRTAAQVVRRFFGAPDEALEIIGITGTNGKTTVSMLLQHLLAQPGQPCGLIGTVRYDLGARTLPSFRTTPEALDIHGMLSQMRDASCPRAVMEISSHAIDQGRVDGLRVDIAAFLNLSQDHLDYHETMDAYYAVKRRLFTGELGNTPRLAVINRDDPRGQQLLAELPPDIEVISFGEHPEATIRSEDVETGPDGSTFRLLWDGQAALVRTVMLGDYNVQNILAALALAKAAGRDIGELIERIGNFQGVPGRMERLYPRLPFNIVVDYAHTDDAMRKACRMLREVIDGRLIVVFGCGGNRDRAKRPLMTRAVLDYADQAYITADNPRKEPLAQIFEDMKAGIDRPEQAQFIEDRRHAINLALDAAQPGDCVLIAGKGHETYQEFADTIIPFDDRAVVRELLRHKRLIDG
ncbi:MAG: UDP-N-acetylmuramoyl-L-alanyl-D-glutamate--2,6-diaminopimelate ligase, partial [Verrucomicrobiota bacterium]